MRTRSPRRRAASVIAIAALMMALSAPAASAQGLAAPQIFKGSSEGLALNLSITAPPALLGALGQQGNTIDLRVSQTLAELSQTGAATTTTLLSGLLSESLTTQGTEASAIIPPQDILGIISLGVGVMEQTADAATGVSRSYSELAHLKVSLEGLLGGGGVGAVSGDLQGILNQATGVVNELLGEVNDTLGLLEGVVNEVLEDAPIDIPIVSTDQVLDIPDLTSVPLLEVRKLWSESDVFTEGDSVVSQTVSGIAGASILGGLVKVPAFQYESVARTNGKPGGASADTKTTIIAVQIADGTLIEVSDQGIVIGDFVLDLVGIDGVGDAVQDLLDALTATLGDLLNAVGVSIVEGQGSTQAAPDGSMAQALTSAFAIGVRPLNILGAVSQEAAGLLAIDLNLLPTATTVTAAQAPSYPPPPPGAPDPPAEPPPPHPRTGGTALVMLLGLAAMGAAFRLRYVA